MYPESGASLQKSKLFLLFKKAGGKINRDYFIEHILKNLLYEHAQNLNGEYFFCFQQDSASFLKPQRSKKRLKKKLLDFFCTKGLACIDTESQLIGIFCF
jgi:hypothetical protein